MIDELVSEMQAVVTDARENDDATGYFAAMYLGVTTTVERGLADGTFTTPDRLSELTTAFARRYLDALRFHRRDGLPTESWQVAFRAAQTWRPTVLQHLLVGMNAHINLDLGIACATVAPGAGRRDCRTGARLHADQQRAGRARAGGPGSVEPSVAALPVCR